MSIKVVGLICVLLLVGILSGCSGKSNTLYSRGTLFDVTKQADGTVVAFLHPTLKDNSILITYNSEQAFKELKPLIGHNVRIEYDYTDNGTFQVGNIEYLGVVDLGLSN